MIIAMIKGLWVRKLIYQLILLHLCAAGEVLAAVDGEYERWNKFIVGKTTQIPNLAVRKFLDAAQNKNPYAETIAEGLAQLGPFAPGKNNVFWLPSIDLQINKENWRFISRISDAPKHIQNLAVYKKSNKTFIRMILHPFSIEKRIFKDLADKNGGFKYEFQGAVTASVRSLVAWKTTAIRNPGVHSKIDFPKDLNRIFQTKVSLYGVDIDGSRLNPAKKMVRAESVSRLMAAIPSGIKQKIGFDFSGEWIIGVPTSSEAGFVYREMLSQYKRSSQTYIEPGHATLSPERLTRMTRRKSDKLKVVSDLLFEPVAKTFSYLLFQEGMIGEFHSQNYGFEINRNGMPTGRIVIHDADSFRTSLQMRVLGRKQTNSFRDIEHPFFYAKDGIFNQPQNASGESYTVNDLLDYMIGSYKDRSGMVGAIYYWCRGMNKVPQWCKPQKIRKELLQRLAKYLSHYLKRKVLVSEFDVEAQKPGMRGLTVLFKEHLANLAAKYTESISIVGQQRRLAQEFNRLLGRGHGRAHGVTPTVENSYFVLHRDSDSHAITAHSKNNRNQLKGVALLRSSNEAASRNFMKSFGISFECQRLKKGQTRQQGKLPILPLMRNMGGGNNVSWLDWLGLANWSYAVN
jgi:hypothetical protein